MNRVLHYVQRAWWFYYDRYQPLLPKETHFFWQDVIPVSFVKESLLPSCE